MCALRCIDTVHHFALLILFYREIEREESEWEAMGTSNFSAACFANSIVKQLAVILLRDLVMMLMCVLFPILDVKYF